MATALKEIYNHDFINDLANSLEKYSPQFDSKIFFASFQKVPWKRMELKERMAHITHTLAENLPSSYSKALKIIYKLAPEFTGLAGIIFPDFVEKYGKELKHFDLSLAALKKLTPYSTSEFAIRHFIALKPEVVTKLMLEWAKDPSADVRRLASEGIRPKLPWAIKVNYLIEHPKPIIKVLSLLKNDPSLYVRKSVANNLNDLSKTYPEEVLELCEKWYGKSENTNWIIKHGLRTLLKRGNQRALSLFGHQRIDAKLKEFHCDSKVYVGEKFNFNAHFEVKTNSQVRLEYAIGFRLKNGSHFFKVFKIAEKSIGPGVHLVSKSHSFKKITTRTFYDGEHTIKLLINGQVLVEKSFLLKA